MTDPKPKELIVKPTVAVSSLRDFLSKLKEKGNLIVNVDPKIAGRGFRTIYESEDADIVICTTFDQLKSLKSSGKSVGYFKKVTSNLDVDEIEGASENGAEFVIVEATDWKIIPLENIIAKLHKVQNKSVRHGKKLARGCDIVCSP